MAGQPRSSDLPADIRGAGAGDEPPLWLVHGFTQNRHCWGPCAEQLGRTRRVNTLDLPGHGKGGPALDPWATADRLAAAGPQDVPSDWLGYSLGGRMLLHLLLAHPGAARRVVLIGASAGLRDPSERRARVSSDHALADRLEAEGVDAFLEGWLQLPLFAGLPAWARFEEHRRANTAAGLAGSLRLAGTGAQDNLWPRLGEIETPVLVLAGALDAKFTALGRALADALPHGEFRAIPAAGHAAHLEAPAATAALVDGWLRRAGSR
ncbi:MAG: alpha/beta fold hydrolase [Microthrixaceae bacterium]